MKVTVPSEYKMALKRRLQVEDIAQELILDSDSDVHASGDISSQSASDTDEDDRTNTGCRDWTDSTQSSP
jgi:hypothetical protein